jgi:hypothetical protein
MPVKKIWINLSIFNLCTVAFLGFALRSKALFELRFIDYNHLVDGHGHFAFEGWVTLSLLLLFVSEFLPLNESERPVYQWSFGGIVITSWLLLISFSLQGNSTITNILLTVFFIILYVFSGFFLKDILKTNLNRPVKILAVSAIICMILSTMGALTIAVLFAVKSRNGIYYRDAMYTYLHFQYNGFFTLAVMALLFQKLLTKVNEQTKNNISRFSVLLTLSVLPSLFLSFLWHDPHYIFRAIAVAGVVLVFLCFLWFIKITLSAREAINSIHPYIRYLGILSMTAFVIKEFLQGFTIFPLIGNAVFGNRPTIMGFLHLVFLGMATLFILAWYSYKGVLTIENKFTKISLIVFSCGVILNELSLMIQGFESMFVIGYAFFGWALWGISIILLSGAIMIGIARILSSKETGKINAGTK